MEIFKIILITIISIVFQTNANKNNRDVIFFSNSCASGKCIPLKQCKHLYEISIKINLTESERNLLIQSICTDEPNNVCCEYEKQIITTSLADNNNYDIYNSDNYKNGYIRNKKLNESYIDHPNINLLPNPGICGLFSSNRIYKGNVTSPEEYPWTVLLKYLQINNSTVEFHCGGTLINERYVVTAAHCINNQQIKKSNLILNGVRLGEWDLNSALDCIDENDSNDCADPVIDLNIDEIIVHENYNENSIILDFDIALIRLSKTIEYTDFIRPVCLLKSPTLWKRNYNDVRMVIVGWGHMENSKAYNVKFSVGVIGVDNEECNNNLRQYSFIIGNNVLCVSNKRNSFFGDSGGSLIATNTDILFGPHDYLAGISSISSITHDNNGIEEWTSVFTRVSSFTEWILNNIKV